MLNNKDILITGGTGSFGKKCTEMILKRYKPKRLIIFLNGEYFITVAISDLQVMFACDRKDYIANFYIKSKLSKSNLPISEGLFRAKHNWKII